MNSSGYKTVNMALIFLYKLYKNGNGGGFRTSSQCSPEVRWHRAFLLPKNIATKTGTLFWRREVLVFAPQNAPQTRRKGKGREDERAVVLFLK